MIQVQELRIDSLVNINEETRIDNTEEHPLINPLFLIKSIDEDGEITIYSEIENLHITCELEELQPIPLTEQWLKDFGFKKELDNSMVKGDIAIFLDRRFKTNLFLRDNQENKWFSFNCKIQYVHQIQNLYFTLVGEELTLNK